MRDSRILERERERERERLECGSGSSVTEQVSHTSPAFLSSSHLQTFLLCLPVSVPSSLVLLVPN